MTFFASSHSHPSYMLWREHFDLKTRLPKRIPSKSNIFLILWFTNTREAVFVNRRFKAPAVRLCLGDLLSSFLLLTLLAKLRHPRFLRVTNENIDFGRSSSMWHFNLVRKSTFWCGNLCGLVRIGRSRHQHWRTVGREQHHA